MRLYVYMGEDTPEFTHGYVYRMLGIDNETGMIYISSNLQDVYLSLFEMRNCFVKFEKSAA